MTWITKFSSETSPGMIQSKTVKETEEQIMDLFARQLYCLKRNHQNRLKNISIDANKEEVVDFLLNDWKPNKNYT